MGSNINIGLVYNGIIGIELESLLNIFTANHGYIEQVKYCEDMEGENWVELDKPNLDSTLLEKLTNSYFGQMQLSVDLFQIKNLQVGIRIEICEEYSGLLLSFKENQIFPDYSIKELEVMTDKIIDFVIEIFPVLNFTYAICDHEAEIEFSPNEFKPEKYSLSFTPDVSAGTLNVRKSGWHINGLSERK